VEVERVGTVTTTGVEADEWTGSRHLLAAQEHGVLGGLVVRETRIGEDRI
jgi:hypothetical protein